MPTQPAHQAKAAKCRELAEQAKNPEDRERWLGMERFWLRQTGPGAMTPAEDPELIKL